MALVLGIETSCDETAVGIVDNRKLLANVISSSVDQHARFGGVVPEVASRAHLEAMQQVIKQALKEAKVSIKDIDGAQNTLDSIKKLALNKSAGGQLICAEFVEKLFNRTIDGYFKHEAFKKDFALEFENFSVLSWERALIHFVKTRPEKSPSFNEILKVVEMYEYSNIALQEKINFLAIFKK